MPLILGVGIGGTAISSALSAYGAGQQADASKEATAQQMALAQQAMDQSQQAGRVGAIGQAGASDAASATLAGYGAQGIGELQQGRDMALGQLLGYGGQAQSALGGGYENALNAYQQGMGQSSAFNDLMANPQAYLAQDPGYQFRQQQGEQALNRMQAARGGRFSGRAAQELSNFNQGLASQEFGAAAQRAQAQDAANMGRYQGLAGLYGAQGQGMAALYGQQGQDLANLFTGTGSQLASAYGGLGTQLANNYNQGAVNQSNALQGAAGQSGGIAQTMLPQYQVAPQYAGGTYGAIAQGIGNLSGLATQYGAQNMNNFGTDWAAAGNATRDPAAIAKYGGS